MAGNESQDIEGLLEKLHGCAPGTDKGNGRYAKDIIVDISEHLSVDLSPVQYELYLSHIFGPKGIIVFGTKVLKDNGFVDARGSTFDLIITLLKKDARKIIKYIGDITNYALFLYNADKSAKVCTLALEAFYLLLEKYSTHVNIQDINLHQFIETICIQSQASKGSSVVLHNQLRILGMLAKVYPEHVRNQSNLILRVFKEHLAKHMGKHTNLIALAGVLRGLTLYLCHFPEGADDNPALYEKLYEHIHKILNPDCNLSRRDAQRAALELISVHGEKFSKQLYHEYDEVFRWLQKWCSSRNRDDYKAAVPAQDTFVTVISKCLELQPAEDKKAIEIFKHFLQEYNKLLETGNSSSKVSLAVKGYGLLAGACRSLLSPQEVHTMFLQVLSASHHAFYKSSEMLEDRLSNLPSYIESLADIINSMTTISVSVVENVQQLVLALVENFPSVSMYKMFLAYRSLFKIFCVLRGKAEYYQDFMHSFVYKSIIRTCSHPPEIEPLDKDGEFWKKAPEKWEGVKNETITYRNYLPLWKALMMPENVGKVKLSDVSTAVLMEISSKLYTEYITSTLEIIEKLDLTTLKQEEPEAIDADNSADNVATSDPIAGVNARTPKDFQVYINIVALMEEVLPLQYRDQLQPHVSCLCWFFIRCSSQQPLVSAHYTSLTTVLSCTQKMRYFEKKEDPEVDTLIHLLGSYIGEVLQRCRQYRDQLLAACLTLILKLPLCIVTEIFPKLIIPLQMALQLGVSYLPLAEVCIGALHAWTRTLPHDALQQHLPTVLPLLLPYLRSQETGEAEVQTRIITVKMAFANQRRKVDKKKVLAGKQVDNTAMKKVQLSILKLIGGLDPSLGRYVIPQDPDSLAAAAVRWDCQKHIRFALPFGQTKIDIYLDDLLPRVMDLALNSSDRQTKVAASELLHSIIIVMIGIGSQQQQAVKEGDSMALLYRHIFQAMLQLACDPDQVTRQLFATLAFQTIHWFTNNSFDNPDTAVLLEAIMSGIVTANNPALRDISAQCLAEFVKWSRKQSGGKGNPLLNLKSILKRIFSFCKHPSAFKRLGGALAWNSIYREVREDSQAVDIWTLEILSHLMLAFDLAQADDPAIGTHEQTRAAILHVKRILIVKKELFWEKSSNRRTPPDFEGETFEDILVWLLKQCGSPKTLVRHASMELLETLAPHAKNCTSVHAFVGRHLQRPDSVEELVDIIEGGGQSGQDLRHHADPALFTREQVAGNHLNIFFEGLLAALDFFSWLIGKGIVRAEKLLKCKESKVFKATSYFLKHMSVAPIQDYLKKTANLVEAETLKTPLEYEALTRLKCTVVVRVLDTLTVMLQDGVQSVDLLDEYSIWSVDLYDLVYQCLFYPASVGFDIRDTEVTRHLPSRLEELLQVMKGKVPQQVSKAFVQHLQETLESSQGFIKMFDAPLDESTDMSLQSQHTIEGLKILHKSGWLKHCSVVQASLAPEMVGLVCSSLFSGQGTGQVATYPQPVHLPFLCAVLDLAVTLDSEVCRVLVKQVTCMETVKSVTGQQIQKGFHILNILGPKMIPHILPYSDLLVVTLVELVKEGNFLDVMGLSGILLNTLIRNADLRKKYSAKVVQAFLHHWFTFSAEAGKSNIHQESVLDLLSSLFIVDRDGVIKEQCVPHDIGILSFYRGLLLEDKTTLSIKNRALKLLPFFLTMSTQVSESICEDLAMVSFKHFPMQSSEFLDGGARDRDYQQALSEMLTALELSLSLQLLKFVVQLYCSEEKHRYEELFRESLEKFIKQLSVSKQLECLKFVYDMFANPSNIKQNVRYNIVEKVLIPFLQLADLSALVPFYTEFIKPIMAGMAVFIQGRSEEQLRLLVTKIGSLKLLQVMFSRLPRERLFHPGSEISAAYKPSDASCKEMTKEVLLQSSRVAKGELRHDSTQAEFRRLCACAAYTAVIAVLVCVKDDQRFYTSILFNENGARGEALWESLIDCNKNFQFDIEVSFNPSSKRRFVTVRRELKQANQSSAGTVQYLASHYLDDSSLREDLSQFDFSNSVVLAMKEDSQQRIMAANEGTGELWTMVMEQHDYNEHEVMANLTAAIYHMLDTKIMELYQGEQAPILSQVPSWMLLMLQKIESKATHRNVKLFLLRLMMNTTKAFAPYAVHFINPVLNCLIDGTTGDRINYFVCDLIIMVLEWGKKAMVQDNANTRVLVSGVIEFLCRNTPHNRADVFKYNIEVVRAVAECWKSLFTVPYEVIYSFMEVKDGKNREQEAGLHLLGIMLANDIAPYTEGCQAEKTKCEKLLLWLLDSRYASGYSPAAEVVGLVLKYQSTRAEEGQETPWQNRVVSKVLDVFTINQGHGITIIHKIHLHFPSIIHKFMSRLLIILPLLYGIFLTRVLECLRSYLSSVEDVFSYFKEQNILGLLEKREDSTQLVSLDLVHSVLHRLSPPQLLYFLPGITSFSSHPSAKCRETMYEILFWVYNNCSGQLDSEAEQIEVKARVCLLQAIREKDAALRQSVLNFWLEQFKNMSLPQRVLRILQKVYSPDSEESFLELAMYILLEETRYSADYQRNIFQQPLTLCRFREMRVSTAWRARHASMIPLFMETQSSSDASLRSLTQGTETEDVDMEAPRRVEATQANVFSATQQTGATYNWVTESTFNTLAADKEYAATHAPVQTSAALPMFTVGASDSGGQSESKLIRKRFVKEQDREKQHLHFAKLEERRSKMRATLEKERKSRREAQVTLYRQYRVGELPDIQIPHRAVIAPLQALSQRDDKVAQMLFDVVVQGVVDNAPAMLPPREDSTWKQQLGESLNTIISESYMCHPDLLRAILHIVINNGIAVSPEAVAAACLGSHLEALGILVLERQVLVSQREGERSFHPPAKRQRTDLQSTQPPDTSLWINIAELYKNLSMWDVVRGVVHGGLGRINPKTREALEAEALNDYVEAFNVYRTALNTNWTEEPERAEVQLWEESYAFCAAMLGQWSELENFVETRLLHGEAGQASLDHVWTLSRPTVSVLPSIVNSKIMMILDGSETDRNLNAFIDTALGKPERQVLMESTLPLQLAVMSVHQQKIPQAHHYVTVATSTSLLTLAQSSLLIAKPVIGTIRDIQLITEFGEFLETVDYAYSENYPNRVRQTVKNWRNQVTSFSDSSLLMQFLSSHRDLYLHLLEKELPEDCMEDIQQLMKDTKASLHKSVIRTALRNKNYHLANRHLKKFKQLCEDDKALAQYYFFMTETIVQRGHSRHQNTLKCLVEAWSKCLGKVNGMTFVEQDAMTQIEYLKLESSVGMDVFEALEAMGSSWDEGNDFIKSLFKRFPNAKGRLGLYKELHRCVYGNLNRAIEYAENSLDQGNGASEGMKDQGKDIYMTLAKYCDNCLEKWMEHIDATKYAESLVASVLRAMALGSREAHFYFPRLINLMNDNVSLVGVFKEQAGSVPVWMFLLWINHILVYADKAPSAALLPIIEELAKEYPQAVVYPFRISKQQYDFTGDAGVATKAMCERVESLLCKNSLLHHFVTAMSWVVVPQAGIKSSFEKLYVPAKKEDIEAGLKNVITNFLRVNNRSTRGMPGERGEAFYRDSKFVKTINVALTKQFGENLEKVKKMSLADMKKGLQAISSVLALKKEPILQQLKSYSPWLANFQASKHSDTLEIPGQYSGMSKPLPAYHVNISSFDERVLPMHSLRAPLRIVIRGSDEKDHKYLLKWGEDLRTDQRMQQVFTLMNSLYSGSPLCAHTSFQPSLDTYPVIPLSLKVGILKWVESTQPLKDFMESSFGEGERKCYEEARNAYIAEESWVPGKQPQDKRVVKKYAETVNKVPWDILRRGLVRLSSSNEGFFSLRSVFANSYATMCVSQWLLGVGDRHCGNTLMSLKTGRVVGIDFGHHFETSAQFIKIPELMPFRLTPQIVNVFQPLGHVGMMRDVMVAVLGALQKSCHMILAVTEAFVKEPTQDWLDFVRRAAGGAEESKVEMFSDERLRCLKGKLKGVHPAYITEWALSKNNHLKKNPTAMEKLKKIVLGIGDENKRASMPRNGLTVHEQVDVLLEQATDPNILGRTWLGWDPFL